jgi:P4 family phage/plasmid primase-like protien
MTNAFIDKYAELGFCFIPLINNQKNPILPSWAEYQRRKPFASEIEEWKKRGYQNFGIVCGRVSDNLVVIDIDRAELLYKLNLVEYTKKTLTVVTQKGYHLYFRYEGTEPFQRIQRSWLDVGEEKPHEELRFQGEGCYVVGFGSIHPSGKKYEIMEGSPLSVMTVPKSVFEEIDKRWRDYHDISKVEEVPPETVKRASEIDEWKNKINLSSIIEQYVTPVRRSSKYWQGLCPFHNDHDPSFTVYNDSWFCFGCNEGGDVISFIQKIENLTFIEAVKKLEDRTGVKYLSTSRGTSKEEDLTPKEIANLLMEEERFAVISDNFEFMWWDGVKWCFNGKVAVKEKAQKVMDTLGKGGKVSNHMIEEIEGHIERVCFIERSILNTYKSKIPLLNGVYDLETSKLLPLSPDFYFTFCLPVYYEEGAECPKVMKFLSEVFRGVEEEIPLLQEIFGYALYPLMPARTSFWWYGSGGNGKTSTAYLLTALLGEENVTSIDLHVLENNRFASSELFGKLANMVGEPDPRELDKSSLFKQATGGDVIRAEKKGRDFFYFRNFAKFIVYANEFPKINDVTQAFWDRVILLAFPNRFREGGDIKMYTQTLSKDKKEMSGLLNWAIEGLRRLMTNNWEFTQVKTSEETKTEFMKQSNPLNAFIRERIKVEIGSKESFTDLYQAYKDYCDEFGFEVQSEKALASKLRNVPRIAKMDWKEGKKHILGYKNIKIMREEGDRSEVRRLPIEAVIEELPVSEEVIKEEPVQTTQLQEEPIVEQEVPTPEHEVPLPEQEEEMMAVAPNQMATKENIEKLLQCVQEKTQGKDRFTEDLVKETCREMGIEDWKKFITFALDGKYWIQGELGTYEIVKRVEGDGQRDVMIEVIKDTLPFVSPISKKSYPSFPEKTIVTVEPFVASLLVKGGYGRVLSQLPTTEVAGLKSEG